MVQAERLEYDVAIIGGGPGGATTGSLMRIHAPEFSVGIFEKEVFPREHVGESLLPPINDVLVEMGAWDAVERADFPIKVGATFRWGRDTDLWDFELIPAGRFEDEPRPANYAGQRRFTSFQVERARYDEILLDRAAELGCSVHQGTAIARVVRDDTDPDRIDHLVLRDGRTVHARQFVDASGHVGVLRRAMDVPTEIPTQLKNIAFWDYWDDAEWAVEIGTGGTRIRICSLDYGWLWFIPIGPTRCSIGLVCNADWYKESGKTPDELYADAVANESLVSQLTKDARREGTLHSTTDWSFVAERLTGANWMLVGEAGGFADPVLSAGLTLTHLGAREAAYSIASMFRGDHDAEWLMGHYCSTQRRRVRQHIRFADYWYAANGQFTDLQEHCSEIAKSAGLRLSPSAAWRWLASGGFSNDFVGQAGIGMMSVASMRQIMQRFADTPSRWQVSEGNVFTLATGGATEESIPVYSDGRVDTADCLVRGDARLPLTGVFGLLVELLRVHQDAGSLHQAIQMYAKTAGGNPKEVLEHTMQCLEVLISEQWVHVGLDKKKPRITIETPEEGDSVHMNRDPERAAAGE